MPLVSLALSGLGRDALKVVCGFGLAVIIILAFANSSLTPFTSVAAPVQAVIGYGYGEYYVVMQDLQGSEFCLQ